MGTDIGDIKKTVEFAYSLKPEALVWKPIYPNNRIGNRIVGYYALILVRHSNGAVDGRKYSIIFQHSEKYGCGPTTEEIECYILFEKSLYEIAGPLDYPEPRTYGNEYSLNEDITLHDYGVNDYGAFVRAYRDIEAAKKRAVFQFQAIYGYAMAHCIPPEDNWVPALRPKGDDTGCGADMTHDLAVKALGGCVSNTDDVGDGLRYTEQHRQTATFTNENAAGGAGTTMKTVQWWLRELDVAELERVYWEGHPVSLTEVPKGCTCGTLRQKLRDFICLLRKLPAVKAENACVFFCGPALPSGLGSVATYLRTLSSLQADGEKPPRCSCMDSDWEEVLGYLVAETPFTSENIYAMTADILFEMSFLGFIQDQRAEKLRHLPEEADTPWEECVNRDAAAERLGLHPKKADPEELRLMEEINKAESAYADHCFFRELRILRAMLNKREERGL